MPNNNTLLLIRGLPGSGKTTLLNLLTSRFEGFCADDFFMVEGEYIFDPSKLSQAHALCLRHTRQHLTEECAPVRQAAVHNTFTQRWEMEPYIQLAEETGARLVVIDLFGGGLTDKELAARNGHGVPMEAIARMRARYEHDWKNGNPLPPWERGK